MICRLATAARTQSSNIDVFLLLCMCGLQPFVVKIPLASRAPLVWSCMWHCDRWLRRRKDAACLRAQYIAATSFHAATQPRKIPVRGLSNRCDPKSEGSNDVQRSFHRHDVRQFAAGVLRREASLGSRCVGIAPCCRTRINTSIRILTRAAPVEAIPNQVDGVAETMEPA